MSITIKEIANICQVSTATVSRVINTPDKVSEKTRSKVKKVVEEYNYIPNQIAKNFSSNISNSIALFVFDIMNPFFTELIKRLNKYAFDENYSLLICDTANSRERELKYIDYINMSKIAGLILTEGVSADTINKIDESCPVVCIDRYVDCCKDYLLVTSANREGANTAVEYLVNLNHRKIAFLGGPEGVKTADERKKGYLDIVKKHDLPIDERYILTGDFKRESGIEALEYFLSLDESPTAVFCANDLMAEGILSRALSLNLNIPEDLSLIGFDGVSNNYFKRMTTVRQLLDEITGVVMSELFKMFQNDNYYNDEEIKIPTRLFIGDTCQKYID
ncbi:MAG TPA: LacI family DNA-binding transcriptional regulator [Halanaerobiales bacterium]|nr:LacI family DNA-binding transcriptional regulator [Halanaerobiales bacterium]